MKYTIKRGDSLFKIAQRYGVTVNAIVNANPEITNPASIFPGQVITIPETAGQVYTVRPGDSLYRIGRRFGTSINSILAANPQITNPNALFIGQQIRIPTGGNAPADPIVTPVDPYGYDEMVADIQQLQETYPFLNFQSVGTSVEGRNLYVVRLGEGPREVHYQGAIHANEWITALSLMTFIEDYARAYTENTNLNGYNIQDLYQQVRIWVMPMANPDGVELVTKGISPNNPYYNTVLTANDGSTDFNRWKANIRGVDLNDQFPAFWEEEKARTVVDRPYYRDYPGPYPFSEPESKAMGNFTYSHNFRLIVAVHSQGEVIYWGYRGFEPPVSRIIVENMARVSGYQPIQYVLSDAGYRDWFILDWRRPGFTVEVGSGVNPLPVSQLPQIYSKLRPILLYAAVA
ncbi:MAG: LysM peptidoglycan-binding domain-containing protein [Desulfobacterales bacterium]|nr:LysM peptidoglycan-binding domain-containing protein [Desulfobacterales bacterium]